MTCHRRLAWGLSALLLAPGSVARADDIWLGAYRHDVTIAQTRFETGQDIKAGWIGHPIDGLQAIGRPSPHVLVSKSLAGQIDYAAIGLNWTFGSRLYLRPGIGLAVHDGPASAYRSGRRVDLGSPVVFEPELAIGWQFGERYRLEASWIHLSHATLFSHQNRGMDSMGIRILIRLK